MTAKSFDWDRKIFPPSSSWTWLPQGAQPMGLTLSECSPQSPACTQWGLVLGCGPGRPRMGEEKEAADCLIARSPDCQISVAVIAGEVSQLGVEEGRNRP